MTDLLVTLTARRAGKVLEMAERINASLDAGLKVVLIEPGQPLTPIYAAYDDGMRLMVRPGVKGRFRAIEPTHGISYPDGWPEWRQVEFVQ